MIVKRAHPEKCEAVFGEDARIKKERVHFVMHALLFLPDGLEVFRPANSYLIYS